MIVVFFIAVAQALTIVLTIRREKDVKELREFVDRQRLHNVKLTAWLAGNKSAARQRPKKSKRETTGEPATRESKATLRLSNSVPNPCALVDARTSEQR